MMSFPGYCLMAFLLGYCSGAEVQWNLSMDTYVPKVSTLITQKYEELLNATEEFKPSSAACAVSMNSSIDACMTCLDTLSCDSGSSFFTFPTAPPSSFEDALAFAVRGIAAGVYTLHVNYGPAVINGLKNGFEGLGSIFESVGNAISSGLKAAFESMQNAFESLFSSFPSIYQFGKRRRSISDKWIMSLKESSQRKESAKSTVDREKRTILTHDQIECMSECSECSAFVSQDEETAMRAICGDTVTNTNITLAAALAQYQAYLDDFEAATQDLIAAVWVDDVSYNLTRIQALKGNTYVTYNVTAEKIALGLWSQDPTYVAIAEYMYKQYA